MSTRIVRGWGVAAICTIGIVALFSTAHAEQLEFDLYDIHGRRVQSQDYEGRPLFLEFGACW